MVEKAETSLKSRRRKVTDESVEATIRQHQDLGPLHNLLLKACPPNPDGVKSIEVLAKALKLSSWSIYKWIGKGRIPPRRAVEVVDVSGGRTTLADFAPFVYA